MSDVNSILDKIGPWHVTVFLMVVVRGLPLATNGLFLSFAAPAKQDHWCARPPHLKDQYSVDSWKNQAIPNDGQWYSKCLVRKFTETENGSFIFVNETENCSEWEYDTTYYNWTLVQEFSLVCDHSWYVSASQATFMAGLMIGNILFAKIADRHGRRVALLIGSILIIIGGYLTPICHDIWSFNMVRFFTSIACGAYQGTIVTLLVECLSERKRGWSVMFPLGWFAGKIVLTATAFIFRNWIHQQLLNSSAAVICLVVCLFVPESPRWLIAVGRVDEARRSLNNVVNKNKVQGVNIDQVLLNSKSSPKKNDNISYFDLYRGPRLRFRTVSIIIMFFCHRLLLFHLTFFAARMGGNPFIGFTLATLLTLPSVLLSGVVIRFVKRRIMVSLTFFATGCCILLMIAFGEDNLSLRVTFCIVASSINALAASVLDVYSSELLPTVIRATGMGNGYTCSRIGAVVAPFFKEIADTGGPIIHAGAAFAVCILGASCPLLLPETFNQPLPQSLSDVDPDLYRPVKYQNEQAAQ